MTKFLDGPAAGQIIGLRRAPLFLRAACSARGQWDALDLLNDEPRRGEALHAYVRVGKSTTVFIRAARGRGGRYEMAEYRVAPVQPDEATMHCNRLWQAWCHLHAPQLLMIDAAGGAA